MSKKFTSEQVMQALRTAVEKRGESWVYPQSDDDDDWTLAGVGCRYRLTSGEPACIAGQVFYELDPELLEIAAAFEGQSAFDVVDEMAERFEDPYIAGIVLRAAQERQDNRDTWGEAEAAAEHEYKRLTEG